ncbi:hypothetical protein [Piscinibacter terrae]|uniref:hypothetical protein n=1 Tax=Piscinibacter terrae TaxID=2496871 RepID=UPI001386AAAA|nr:hypothetical protein [Albitalea terrae]
MSKSGQQATKADRGGQRADKTAKPAPSSTPSAKDKEKEKSPSKKSDGGTAKR